MTRIAMSTWTFIFPPTRETGGVRQRSRPCCAARVRRSGDGLVRAASDRGKPRLRRDASRVPRRVRTPGLGLAGVVANFDECPSILSSADNSQYLLALDEQLDLCADLGITSLGSISRIRRRSWRVLTTTPPTRGS